MPFELKKFIVKAALFVVVLVFVLFCTNILYITIIEKRTIYWRNLADYDRYFSEPKNRELDFAFFGTSVTRDSMNPSLIPGSVNFSLSAQNYIIIYYRLLYLLERYDLDIDNLVLEIDTVTFSDTMYAPDSLANYDYAKMLPMREIVERSGLSWIDVLIRSQFPFVGRGLQAYGALRTPPMELYLGWAKEFGDLSKNPMDIEKMVREMPDKEPLPNDVLMEYFGKTIDLAKEKGINVVFLKNPIAGRSQVYYEKYGVSYDRYYQDIDNEIRKRLPDYRVFDYSDLLIANDELMHVDGGHVNYLGADKVSKRFWEDVKSLVNTVEK